MKQSYATLANPPNLLAWDTSSWCGEFRRGKTTQRRCNGRCNAVIRLSPYVPRASAPRVPALGAYDQVFGANSQVRARQASYIPFSHNHQQRGWRSILPERFTELRIDGHIMEVKQWYEALSL